MLASLRKHRSKFSQVFRAGEPTSHTLLDEYHLGSAFVEVNFNEVSRSITSIKTLDEDSRTVTLENSLESINVNFKIQQMLLG